MTAITSPSQRADNSVSSETPDIPREPSQWGSVYFDVAIPSRIVGAKREQIRTCFEHVVYELTGYDNPQDLGKLCEFMSHKLTSYSNRMPAHGTGMEERLNQPVVGYLALIVAFDLPPVTGTIREYAAVLDVNGTDLYCYGPNGERRCYHFFELSPKTPEVEPILMPEDAKFRICCVAQIPTRLDSYR